MTTPNICVLIPVYNHDRTVKQVVGGAACVLPVIAVNDGSTDQTAALLAGEPSVTVVTLPTNQGKAAALHAGFVHAREAGFSHAITIDADGQHPVDALADFVKACQCAPEAFIIGVRDLKAAKAPLARLISNWLSTVTFRMETGIRLSDTQCGYRCYPLEQIDQLWVRSKRYAYELEVMVRAAWAGIPLVPVPVGTDYQAPTSRLSHFRPLADFVRIFLLHVQLAVQTFCVPAPLRRLLSLKSFRNSPRATKMRSIFHHMLSENAESPGRQAFAVGLGFFCGIAPIWGAQTVTAAFLAQLLRLNKVIAVVASNISFPLGVPLIMAAGLKLGHFIFTGQWADSSPGDVPNQISLFFWYWFVGSVVLAMIVAVLGATISFLTARAFVSSPSH